MVLCRYSITEAIGKSHLILGKISEPSVLTPDDIAAIQERTSFCQQTAKLYHRVIISGTMYTSSSYTRPKITNDSILSFKDDGQNSLAVQSVMLASAQMNVWTVLNYASTWLLLNFTEFYL